MADRIDRIEEEGWGGRLGGSARGVLTGAVFALAAIVLLFWNEGRAVRRAQALEEGARTVRSIAGDTIDPGLEGRLVHVSGRAESPETLRDVDFRLATDQIELIRRVEMYQWTESETRETEQKVGGGTRTTTTFTYEREWSSDPVDSSSFEEPEEHTNPPFPIVGRSWRASTVTVGVFHLSEELVAKLGGREPLPVDPESIPGQVAGLPVHSAGEGFYLGEDPVRPRIGDVKVSFEVVPEGEVSIVARQVGGNLAPYSTSNRGTLALLQRGVVPADDMFETAKAGNKTLTWILRGVGFLFLWMGLGLVLRPIKVLADVVPVLGSLVGAGTGVLAGLGAAFVSLVVIAVGWIFYRPWLGAAILAGALVVLVLIVRRIAAARRRGRVSAGTSGRKVATTPAAPPPPVPGRGSSGPPPAPPGPPSGSSASETGTSNGPSEAGPGSGSRRGPDQG